MVKRKKLTGDMNYIAGLLDCKGGFYSFRGASKKKYLGFKLVGDPDDAKVNAIVMYMPNVGVNFGSYEAYGKMIHTVGDKKSIERLIQFMKDYCIRDDYKNFRYGKRIGWYKIDRQRKRL